MDNRIKICINIFNMCCWVAIAILQVAVIGEVSIPVFVCAIVVIIAYALGDIAKVMLSDNMSQYNGIKEGMECEK